MGSRRRDELGNHRRQRDHRRDLEGARSQDSVRPGQLAATSAAGSCPGRSHRAATWADSGSRVAPEEEFGEGTSRLKLYTADISLNAPFKLGEQKLRHSGLIRAQWNRTPLTPQDRFAIGGRYTVRRHEGRWTERWRT
jgi:hypothetical protein